MSIKSIWNKSRERKQHNEERRERLEDLKAELELQGHHIYKKTPEEVELNSYLEEEHRDTVRSLVLKKRKERLNKMLGHSYYGSEEENPMKPKKFNKFPKLPKAKWL